MSRYGIYHRLMAQHQAAIDAATREMEKPPQAAASQPAKLPEKRPFGRLIQSRYETISTAPGPMQTLEQSGYFEKVQQQRPIVQEAPTPAAPDRFHTYRQVMESHRSALEAAAAVDPEAIYEAAYADPVLVEAEMEAAPSGEITEAMAE
jgi:hypothetical protein